jgi:hypothetical protein
VVEQWQRGLALYFSSRFAESSAQFEKDLEANNADVEEVCVLLRFCVPLIECGIQSVVWWRCRLVAVAAANCAVFDSGWQSKF